MARWIPTKAKTETLETRVCRRFDKGEWSVVGYDCDRAHARAEEWAEASGRVVLVWESPNGEWALGPEGVDLPECWVHQSWVKPAYMGES